jgi:rhomboid protease GluP
MELPPKLWFQLERLKKVLRSTFGTSGQNYDSSHRMCPNCRALIERNASVCPFCGEKLRSPRARSAPGSPGRILGIIPIPSSGTSAVATVTIALYGISWYMTATSASAQLNPVSGMGGISNEVLFRLGAKSIAILYYGQWWRLVTAIFLHAGLLHIGLNLWCLFDLGPEVESLFSTAKFVVFYLVAGVAGFLLSLWWSPVQSVGASGSVLGLIGILIGASFHHGHLGKAYRGQLWRWVIYIAIFGLFFPVDNAAHFGGLASGVLLGYVVPEGEADTRASQNLWNALAVLSVVIIAGSFALMALQLGQPLH